MAADLAEAGGAGAGVVLSTGQTEVGAASIVVPTAVFPCSKSPEREGQVRPKVGRRGPKASEWGFSKGMIFLKEKTMSSYFVYLSPPMSRVNA